MTNQQLLQIAEEDFNHLTSEAKSALLAELEKRKIKLKWFDEASA